jgi:hypothetical protein
MNYFKSLKLKNGDIMAVEMDKDIKTSDAVDYRYIKVKNPVVFTSFKFLDENAELVETISMMPMMPISMDEEFELAADHIFSIAVMSEAATERYKNFLEHLFKIDAEEAAEIKQEAVDAEEVTNIHQFRNKQIH